VEADLFMVTLQAEPHAAAEIAEIARIDPTARAVSNSRH